VCRNRHFSVKIYLSYPIVYYKYSTCTFKGTLNLRLTANAIRNALALRRGFTAGNRDIREREVRAGGAEDIDIGAIGVHRTLDIGKGDAADRNSVSGSAGGGTVLVVLLDDDTVVRDVLKGDAGVCDVGHRSCRIVDGLDANT
jgi:hypothetical protein